MKLAYAYHMSEPFSGLDAFEAEHKRCTQMWDRLVDMDAEFERELHAAIAKDSAEWVIAQKEIQEIRSARWEEGDKARNLRRLRELRQACWDAEKAWMKEHAEFTREQTSRRFERIKEIRRSSGCYWPNYNSVISRYEAGRQSAKKFGRRMRHHDPLRDDAMLCVQIQRTRTGLGAAPEELPALSMIALGARPAHGKPIVELRMRVTEDGQEIAAHVLMHRRLPQCRIKGAQVCRHRRGKDAQWRLILQLADVEMPARINYAREGSITFGWEMLEDGGLLVARPSWREPYVLPADWMLDMDRVERLQSLLQESLQTQIKIADPETRARLERSSHLDVRLLRQNEVPPAMREWLRSWKLEYERWTHGRAKYLARRQHIYRQWAREIVRECPRLAIETKRLDRIARDDRGTEPNSYRQRACVHSLRAEIIHQATKVGALVVADDIASGSVLTRSDDDKSGAWQRRKARKQERSQSASQVTDLEVI